MVQPCKEINKKLMENVQVIIAKVNRELSGQLSGLILENPINIGQFIDIDGFTYVVESVFYIQVKYFVKSKRWRLEHGHEFTDNKSKIEQLFKMYGFISLDDFIKLQMKSFVSNGQCISKHFYVMNFFKEHNFKLF